MKKTERVASFESRLFQRFWDDGLLDLFAGVAVLGIGGLWAGDLMTLGGIVPLLLVPFWAPLRRRIVEPRAGFVEFGETRTRKNRHLLVSGLGLGLILLGAFATLAWAATPVAGNLAPRLAPALPAWLLAVLAVVVGFGLQLPRFLVYASFFCLCGLGTALAGSRPEVGMIAGGFLVLVGGAWKLSRFLRLEADPGEAS